MGIFEKILGKKHDTTPASGPETIRDLKKPEENKYNPAERVNMSREEIARQIDEMAKTDKEKANDLRRAMGVPEK